LTLPWPAHNNGRVIRRCIALALAVAVQAMLVELPALHAHLDNHVTEHHQSRTIHSHFDEHHSIRRHDGLRIQTGDHDAAVSFIAIAALTTTSFTTIGLTVATAVLPTPVIRVVAPTFEVTHAHDPPWAGSLPARAPPASLS
jgi:hypothetical protein